MQVSECDNLVTFGAVLTWNRRKHGTRVALAWLMAQPFVTAPINGANSTGQLADSMGASELVLSEEEIGEISNVADWERSRTDREA